MLSWILGCRGMRSGIFDLRRKLTSEVEPKLIFMGHPISPCHVPVVSSFITLFKTLVSSLSICYVHLVKNELITLYCPKISPDCVELTSCTVPMLTCTYPKFNLFCWKNHYVLSQNFTWFCRIGILYCPNFNLYCPKIHLNLSKKCLELDLISCFALKFQLVLSQ